ncbi:hypothetical protein ASPSYDRAFT_48687 [Aspergillus sydowii CBS 593.65]|uniref:Uncharacterized protein n=1 Tax=Aspergillus sydowii CBS 593.65 TaxID=1036612 RepID=A0A1L9T7U3_9EURO|nr:uncharacterized protein ASPSYDRAFT_48687 [Aspergillus sydowii CBS 593.65]OJJ55477.1 hypothetical protein ASPSYDRAFT_48687 [Aspergillus sydowii CBS 593.65]
MVRLIAAVPGYVLRTVYCGLLVRYQRYKGHLPSSIEPILYHSKPKLQESSSITSYLFLFIAMKYLYIFAAFAALASASVTPRAEECETVSPGESCPSDKPYGCNLQGFHYCCTSKC